MLATAPLSIAAVHRILPSRERPNLSVLFERLIANFIFVWIPFLFSLVSMSTGAVREYGPLVSLTVGWELTQSEDKLRNDLGGRCVGRQRVECDDMVTRWGDQRTTANGREWTRSRA